MANYNNILTDAEAKRICNEILESEDYQHTHLGASGYWYEQGRWVAFDNTDGNCWMEEFSKKKHAIAYADGTLDINEYYCTHE